MTSDEQDEVSGHLFDMVKIIYEFPDVLKNLLLAGARIDGSYFIFEHKECNEVFAIDPSSQIILSLNSIDTSPRFGEIIDNVEEIICLIERLVCFVIENKGVDSYQINIFMEQFNPQKYRAGNCFSHN